MRQVDVRTRNRWTAGAVVAAAVIAAVAVAGASRGSGEDTPATGPEAQQAVKAALAVTGGGHANAVERDSEDGATWEVEVTRTDGSTVDVRLDAAYRLVVVEPDSEGG